MALVPVHGAPPARYLIFFLAALGLLMSSIDGTIVAVAIPTLPEALNTSLNWVGWAVTANQLVQIVVLPLAGKLSDELGRKRVFMFCIACFTVGSLLSGLAPSIGLLIFFRALQAVGAAGLMPSAVGIVSDRFGDRRAQAIGLFLSVSPIGAVLGPNLGAWIIDQWSWREIFFVNVPIGFLILVGAHFLLRDSAKVNRSQAIDFRGLALFAGGILAIMYAMTEAGTNPATWQSAQLWALVVMAGILLVLFYRHEQRIEQPVIEIRLLAHRPFLPANLYNFFFGAAIFGISSFVPYYAVVHYKMSTAQSGAVLSPRAAAMIVASAVASLMLLRLGYRRPMIGGMVVMSLGLLLLSFGWSRLTVGSLQLDSFWLMAIEVGLTGLGMGIAAPAANNAILDLLPTRAAAITGLRNMFRFSGGIIGVSGIVLTLSFFDDKAAGMRAVFFGLALFLLLTIPVALMIPDTARNRLRRKEGGSQFASQPGEPAEPRSI